MGKSGTPKNEPRQPWHAQTANPERANLRACEPERVRTAPTEPRRVPT